MLPLYSFAVLCSALSLFAVVTAKDAKAGWTCEADGFWYNNGVKTKNGDCAAKSKEGNKGKTNDKVGKKGTDCSVTKMLSDENIKAVKDLTRTCISHSSNAAGRCWWSYIPKAVASATDGRKVPLLIDMHGGGGCVTHRLKFGAFKAIADEEAAKSGGGLVVVYPQGNTEGTKQHQWSVVGTCKGSCAAKKAETKKGGKSVADWDDIDFLEQLIANVLKVSPHKDKVDAERIYLHGFSMGCMMANRFALERSKIVAAFGCQGGDLTYAPTTTVDMDEVKGIYSIQPMPTYISVGTEDGWFAGGKKSWTAWSHFNACKKNTPTNVKVGKHESIEHRYSDCATHSPALDTVFLELKGMKHVPLSTCDRRIWDFIKKYKRLGALAAVPAVATTTTTTAKSTSSTASHAPTNELAMSVFFFALINLLRTDV